MSLAEEREDGPGAAPTADESEGDAWRAWYVAGGVLAGGYIALIALFWGAAAAAVEVWYDSATFNHGFLILPLCGWLAWTRRQRLLGLAPRPNFWGLAPMAVLAFVWYAGELMGLLLIQQFALIGMIQTLTFTVIGWRATRAMAFPLFYLLFAVPFGDFMIAPLQDFTAVFVVEGLRLVGIPVFLDGIFISIPNGNFEVAEACAGVRFLIATIALGTLFADITYRSWWRRAAFMLLALAVPIVANGLRAFGIVIIAHLTDNEVAVGVDHIVYGWVFFAFVTFILLAVGMTFREHFALSERRGALVAAPPGARHGTRAAVAGLAALVLAAVAPAHAWRSEAAAPVARTAVPAPDIAAPWRPVDRYEGTWQPVFPGADSRLLATYRSPQARVHLFVAYFSRQREDAELVGYENRLLPDDSPWMRAGSGRTVARIDGRKIGIGYTRARGRGTARLIWHWYWVNDRFVGRDLDAKIQQAAARLLRGAPQAAAIAVATDYYDSQEEAAATLQAFLDSLAPLGPALAAAGTR